MRCHLFPTLLLGDCLERMRSMPANSVDSIVTDPPYGLNFMGNAWDKGVPSSLIWAEALRVLKPGGHLLCFSSPRTQHRMATAIEDGGFEIRDMVAWVYGSGFPKSHNAALSIDKHLGHGNRGKAVPTASTYQASDKEKKNKLTSNKVGPYEPKTPEAEPWNGWGNNIKPAIEPITLARKPLEGTIAKNILQHGTGVLNIDGTRVPYSSEADLKKTLSKNPGTSELVESNVYGKDRPQQRVDGAGRYPANLIHDGSEEVLALFPEGSERFFYCSKASKKDKGEGNNHPTCKPTDLMQYLCRLITPPEGVVLDPFMGSGSTGVGALAEGFFFTGIELSEEYFEIARKRLHGLA